VFVVVVEAPDFDGRYGWRDDYHGYMKNGNYGEGLEGAGKVVLGGEVVWMAEMGQRRKSV